VNIAAVPAGLFVAGTAPHEDGTVVLLGPEGSSFWAILKASSEWRDGQPHPVDRWSRRVITDFASNIGGRAVFPFGGPPHAPFFTWAAASGRAWPSPVGMLVHDRMGLWASYRGAVILPQPCAPPEVSAPPCTPCAKPCATACPVGALSSSGYDTKACHAWLSRPEGADCLTLGCRARRACPLAVAHGRLPEEAAHYMRHFHT